MYNKQVKMPQSIIWRRFANKGYSAFASLGREIRIGVLSVSTLAVAANAQAGEDQGREQSVIPEETKDEKEMDAVTVTGTMAPLTTLQSARIVTVLNRTDIERAGVQSVNDLLKLASGVDVRLWYSDGHQH